MVKPDCPVETSRIYKRKTSAQMLLSFIAGLICQTQTGFNGWSFLLPLLTLPFSIVALRISNNGLSLLFVFICGTKTLFKKILINMNCEKASNIFWTVIPAQCADALWEFVFFQRNILYRLILKMQIFFYCVIKQQNDKVSPFLSNVCLLTSVTLKSIIYRHANVVAVWVSLSLLVGWQNNSWVYYCDISYRRSEPWVMPSQMFVHLLQHRQHGGISFSDIKTRLSKDQHYIHIFIRGRMVWSLLKACLPCHVK